MTPQELLKIVKASPRRNPKRRSKMDPYEDSIKLLRKKGYSWNRIADFMTENGVSVSSATLWIWQKKYLK